MELTSESQKEVDEADEIKNLKKVEAAMFIAARYMSLQELVMLTDINPILLREIIEKLTENYSGEDSAIEIITKADMWKMDVKQEYTGMVNKLATGSAEFSKSEQETLAVIAYKQPVKQSVMIKIRGNKAYDHVKHFIEMGLVKFKKMGHTKELSLSDDFYEYFHVQKKKLSEEEIKEKIEEKVEEVEEKGISLEQIQKEVQSSKVIPEEDNVQEEGKKIDKSPEG